MKNVFFRPWVGEDYGAGFRGRRILVLGESHYQWDANIPAYEGLTNDCIQEQIDGERSKFWTNIAITFLNRYPTADDKRAFWNSIAFYNYVQTFAGFGPRVSPTSLMWMDSESAFWDVLEDLRPHSIIALGYRLWENLPSAGQRGPDIAESPQQWTWWYPIGTSGFRTLAYGICHPSAGFSAWSWHPHVMKAVSFAEDPCKPDRSHLSKVTE